VGCRQVRDCGVAMQLYVEIVKALAAPGAMAGEYLHGTISGQESGDHRELGPDGTAGLGPMQVTGRIQSPAWPRSWRGLCCSSWLLFPAAVT